MVTSQMESRGCLIPIGGAEDRRGTRLILNEFIQRSGGAEARIAIIPGASAFPSESGSRYCDIFSDIGASNVQCVDILDRRQANSPSSAALLDDVTGIFLTGGDQVKLLSLRGGTLLGRKIMSRFQAGVTVAGTSAGASALSRHMVAFGRSGSSPSQRMVQLSPGLGLVENVIIDQHFRQRDRLGRLTTAVAFNPSMLGVGIDEDTAFVIGPDRNCEVIGWGSITIVDGTDMEYTNIHSAKRHDPVTVVGMKVHVLTHGQRYNLQFFEESQKTKSPLTGDSASDELCPIGAVEAQNGQSLEPSHRYGKPQMPSAPQGLDVSAGVSVGTSVKVADGV
jgi:cyanophycinase